MAALGKASPGTNALIRSGNIDFSSPTTTHPSSGHHENHTDVFDQEFSSRVSVDNLFEEIQWCRYQWKHLAAAAISYAVFSMNNFSMFFLLLSTRKNQAAGSTSWSVPGSTEKFTSDRTGYHVAVTTYFIGCIVGALLCRWITPRYGRRIPHFVSFAIISFFTGLRIFANVDILFYTITLLIGMACGFSNVTNQSMQQEYFFVDQLEFVASVCNASFAFGYLSLTCLAAFLHEYTPHSAGLFISIALVIVNFAVVPFIFFVKESPKWLESRGRSSEAKKVVEAMVGHVLDVSILQVESRSSRPPLQVLKDFKQELKSVSKSKLMTRTMVVLLFSFYVISLIYYGLSFTADAYDDLNPFVLSTWYALIDIPSFFLATVLSNKLSPRKASIIFLTLCGLALGLQWSGFTSHVFLVVTKTFSSAALTSTFVYSLSMIPVDLRVSTFRLIAGAVGVAAASIGPFRMISNALGGQVICDLLWAVLSVSCALGLTTLTETSALGDAPPTNVTDVEVRHLEAEGNQLSKVTIAPSEDPVPSSTIHNIENVSNINLDQDDFEIMSMAVGFSKEKSFYMKHAQT